MKAGSKNQKKIEIAVPERLESNKTVQYVILIVAGVLSAVGMLFLYMSTTEYSDKIAEAEEISRPAKLDLIEITVSDCEDCYNTASALSDLETQNVEIGSTRKVDYQTVEGKDLIARHKIERVPTFIVSGEISKSDNLEIYLSRIGRINGSDFVYTNLVPVYFDLTENRFRGRVEVTYIADKNCAGCVDPDKIIETYKNSGITISKEKSVDWKSSAGQSLINKYGLTKIPTYILNSEASVYENVTSVWERSGIVKDGKYIATNVYPPYRSTKDGQIKGIVSAVKLTDSSCGECFDINTLEDIVKRNFSVAVEKVEAVDISSERGKTLIARYSIEKAPSMIFSPQLKHYSSLSQTWEQIGTTEEDGWFIFRKPEVVVQGAVYRDIKSGELVNSQQSQ